MSDKTGSTLPPIETCRIKTNRSKQRMTDTEMSRFRDDVEARYGTRDFAEAQRRIFVINQWKTES